jgi:hypothetical protein
MWTGILTELRQNREGSALQCIIFVSEQIDTMQTVYKMIPNKTSGTIGLVGPVPFGQRNGRNEEKL